MRDLSYPLSVPASASTDLGAGAGLGLAQRCRDMTGKVVEVTGTFTGTVKIAVKVANAFLPYGSTLTAPGLIPLDISADSLHVDVTSVNSGTPVCVLRGLDTRADA